MISRGEIERLLRAAFPDAELELTDLTGTQDHYELSIASRAFQGRPLVAQHQLVYKALGAAMQGQVHALALHTFTPENWRKRQ